MRSRLVIPSCSGVLDCFNNKYSRYYSAESKYCLQGKINTPILTTLFSFIFTNRLSPIEPSTWAFKVADYKRFIGYKQGSKSKDVCSLLQELSALEYLCDHVPCGKAITVSLNSTRTVATVKSPYFAEIFAHLKSVYGEYNKYGKKIAHGRSAYSTMVYADICKERNVSAVEIVIELCRLTERRGPLEKGEYAHIGMVSLAERCPTLYARLEKSIPKERDRLLKNALEKALELLEMYTSIYECFEGLRFELPTKITLKKESELKIFYNKRLVKETKENVCI